MSGIKNHQEFRNLRENFMNLPAIFPTILDLNNKLLRSKCEWYQYGKKSTKYFLNLEKIKAVNGTVKK